MPWNLNVTQLITMSWSFFHDECKPCHLHTLLHMLPRGEGEAIESCPCPVHAILSQHQEPDPYYSFQLLNLLTPLYDQRYFSKMGDAVLFTLSVFIYFPKILKHRWSCERWAEKRMAATLMHAAWWAGRVCVWVCVCVLYLINFIVCLEVRWSKCHHPFSSFTGTFEARQKLELSALWRLGRLWRGKLAEIIVFAEDQGEAQH